MNGVQGVLLREVNRKRIHDGNQGRETKMLLERLLSLDFSKSELIVTSIITKTLTPHSVDRTREQKKKPFRIILVPSWRMRQNLSQFRSYKSRFTSTSDISRSLQLAMPPNVTIQSTEVNSKHKRYIIISHVINFTLAAKNVLIRQYAKCIACTNNMLRCANILVSYICHSQ